MPSDVRNAFLNAKLQYTTHCQADLAQNGKSARFASKQAVIASNITFSRENKIGCTVFQNYNYDRSSKCTCYNLANVIFSTHASVVFVRKLALTFFAIIFSCRKPELLDETVIWKSGDGYFR